MDLYSTISIPPVPAVELPLGSECCFSGSIPMVMTQSPFDDAGCVGEVGAVEGGVGGPLGTVIVETSLNSNCDP